MNKILHTTLVFLLFTSVFYAQDFSMTDQGNKWGIRFFDEHCGNQDPDDPDYVECDYTGVYAVTINGETIINNTTYAILGGSMFIREEEGIVYQYTESQGEFILYDFTLEVGDTIEIDSNSNCFGDENNNNLADVIDVSTQFIAGQDRKVITFDLIYGSNFSSNIQWIEGIGSTNNPIYPNLFLCDFVEFLECFNNGEEIFSFSQNEEECNSLLSIPEIPKVTTLLTPNPVTEQSVLTINNFQNKTTITFYNLLGQYIDQKEITNNSMIINRTDFPATGIYFYQIAQNGVITDTQKFIVK